MVSLETDLFPECALALAVEVLDLWAAAGCVFRATAANAAGAGNTNAKARRAEMGAFKRILKNLEARDHQSIFYAIGSSIHMEVISRVPYTFQLTGDGC